MTANAKVASPNRPASRVTANTPPKWSAGIAAAHANRAARVAAIPDEVETPAKAAARLGVSAQLIRDLIPEFLSPIAGGKGSIPYQFSPEDADRALAYYLRSKAETRAKWRARCKRVLGTTKHLTKMQNGKREKLATLPGLSVPDAAEYAGVGVDAIYKAYKQERLKARRNKWPLRFSRPALDKAFGRPLPEGWTPLCKIPDRIPESTDRTLNQVRCAVESLGIKTRKFKDVDINGVKKPMACVREERVPEVIAWVVGDVKADDELNVKEAEKQFRKDHKIIKRALAQYARSAGRVIRPRTSAGVREQTVYPRAAIEAALRGETWTPDEQPPPRKPDPPAGEPDRQGTGGSTEQRWQQGHGEIIQAIEVYAPPPGKRGPSGSTLARLIAGQSAGKSGNLGRLLKDLNEAGVIDNIGGSRAASGYFIADPAAAKSIKN